MFDYDKWQEIFLTIRQNKLRTFLTIFSIGWGMFLVVALTGAGKSFQNGVTKGFEGWAKNSGFIWGQRTTISNGGFGPGRRVRFNESDTKALLSKIKELKNLAPRNSAGEKVVRNKLDPSRYGTYEIYGDYPAYSKIQSQNFVAGRFINEVDIKKQRKVAVIGKRVRDVLFEDDVDPIGKYITFNAANFKVVGVTKPVVEQEGDDELISVYIPFSTFAQTFQTGGSVGWYALSAIETANVDSVQKNMMDLLKTKNKISLADEEAIGFFNLEKQFKKITGIFTGMEMFVYFIGLVILLAGVIGISNIMLIIVKERTKEIGIRKALGATPMSIVSIIIQESVFLTIVGGYLGMLFANLLLDGVNSLILKAMSESGGDAPFGIATVSPEMMFLSFSVLTFGGFIAGIYPAYRAVSIHPVEAIRKD